LPPERDSVVLAAASFLAAKGSSIGGAKQLPELVAIDGEDLRAGGAPNRERG
jgi:hypothetical protein